VSTLTDQLARIGVVTFGQFRVRESFVPVAVHLALIPSYPDVWNPLADEIAALLRAAGKRYVLPTPAAIPLGATAALRAGLPLAFPIDGLNGPIEGAFNFNVPTVLLTDYLTDGAAEEALIRNAGRQGLDVEAVIAVIDGEQCPTLAGGLRPTAWRTLSALIAALDPARLPPLMRESVLAWQRDQRRP
jgi:orotate phosphoribosyltransferase